MLRTSVCLGAMLPVAGRLHTASAQMKAPAPAAATALAGDGRWFSVEDGMGKT